jgi:hypothetical protein
LDTLSGNAKPGSEQLHLDAARGAEFATSQPVFDWSPAVNHRLATSKHLGACYNFLMFRILLYSVLGLMIGLLIIAPLVTHASGVGFAIFALVGTACGAGLALYLNRAVRYESVWDFDNTLWWMDRDPPFPVFFLPHKMKHNFLMGLRSVVTPNKSTRDSSFLDDPLPPVRSVKFDKATGRIVSSEQAEIGDRTCG